MKHGHVAIVIDGANKFLFNILPEYGFDGSKESWAAILRKAAEHVDEKVTGHPGS